jgi:hypothetical protein
MVVIATFCFVCGCYSDSLMFIFINKTVKKPNYSVRLSFSLTSGLMIHIPCLK